MIKYNQLLYQIIESEYKYLCTEVSIRVMANLLNQLTNLHKKRSELSLGMSKVFIQHANLILGKEIVWDGLPIVYTRNQRVWIIKNKTKLSRILMAKFEKYCGLDSVCSEILEIQTAAKQQPNSSQTAAKQQICISNSSQTAAKQQKNTKVYWKSRS